MLVLAFQKKLTSFSKTSPLSCFVKKIWKNSDNFEKSVAKFKVVGGYIRIFCIVLTEFVVLGRHPDTEGRTASDFAFYRDLSADEVEQPFDDVQA